MEATSDVPGTHITIGDYNADGQSDVALIGAPLKGTVRLVNETLASGCIVTAESEPANGWASGMSLVLGDCDLPAARTQFVITGGLPA